MQGFLNFIGVAAKKAGLVLVVGELLGDGGQVKYSDLSQGHPKWCFSERRVPKIAICPEWWAKRR